MISNVVGNFLIPFPAPHTNVWLGADSHCYRTLHQSSFLSLFLAPVFAIALVDLKAKLVQISDEDSPSGLVLSILGEYLPGGEVERE